MEGAIISTQSNSRFRTHLKNAASALCTRTLPKQRHGGVDVSASTAAKHHTYPRVSPQKRAMIPCRLEPFITDCGKSIEPSSPLYVETVVVDKLPDDGLPLRGEMAR